MKGISTFVLNFVAVVLSLLLLTATGYALYLLIDLFIGALGTVDNTLLTAIISAAATILAAVFAVIYNQRRIKAREIAEAHRPEKIKIYKHFMEFMVDILRKTKNKGSGLSEDDIPEKLVAFFFDFTRDVIVWGSPGVIKAYKHFRTIASERNHTQILLAFDDLLKAIRKDLGNSNRGLLEGDLITLFLKDPEVLDQPLTAITAQEADLLQS